jgi:hypothetical protein
MLPNPFKRTEVTGMIFQKLCRPSLHEWFQWLAERLDERPEYRDEEGAYSKYGN